ncbi:DNA-binding transcriptional response regulator [Proteiniphilum saccharofermentans]|uniref:DNA-binding transcriptional response regulator n=1 Tax=Proteiniphilum saccharofermentans TaxID=1642647 RepID=A0A1R3T337_9BACT|nr:sigma-54 dependent transcriptional regulator [Proteiniphilum saccharofermentans]SCD22111.1 DNA-binding transcriptional response regulator [Proteiniphilum saccharofermentans]
MKQGKILVVDDNKNVLSALKILLNAHFEEVTLLSSPTTLLAMLKEKNPDVVLLDMNYSAGINTGNEGLFWLSEVKRVNPDLPIVLFTAYADIDLAVTALKEGATDFVVKPWDNAKLLATLQSALELRLSRKEVVKLKEKQDVLNSQLNRESDIYWGESQAMRELLRLVEKVAKTDANVLITGENGTGKEVIARRIHQLSPRANESLVTVDMGAVTETLFESELFGHVKGSFTDAHNDRAGKIEAADKGTLFLDEIGNLGYPLQAKLLNALQSRQIIRVGSNKPVAVNIRLICATNHNLFLDVENGLFREDLLYRINTIQIEVPPLRDRKEDIPGLASFFLHRFAAKYNKTGVKLSKDAIAKMQEYNWPGNVRELEHTMEKALILSDNRVIDSSDLFLRPQGGSEKGKDLENVTLEEMERVLIERAMSNYGSNISAIAKELGVSRPTLYSKIKKYGL